MSRFCNPKECRCGDEDMLVTLKCGFSFAINAKENLKWWDLNWRQANKDSSKDDPGGPIKVHTRAGTPRQPIANVWGIQIARISATTK